LFLSILHGLGLDALPDGIRVFAQPETLDASNNDLTSLPVSMTAMSKLQTLDVTGNPVALSLALILFFPCFTSICLYTRQDWSGRGLN